MATTHDITTAEQLFETKGIGRSELVRGELITMTPAGSDHSRIALRIGARLAIFVETRHLGIVTGADGGYVIGREPDTVRAPDVGFVKADRAAPGRTPKFFEGAPDLAVEVLSPNDLAGEIAEKVQQWLAAGCRAVWVVDPDSGTVTLHRPDRATVMRRETDVLSGEEIIPGFSVSVADVFGV